MTPRPSASFEAHPLMIELHYGNSTGTYEAYHIMPDSKSAGVESGEEEYETEMRQRVETQESDDELTEEQPCQPMHKWQTQSYVMCNSLHEFDIATETANGAFTLLACGGNRCAFQLGGDVVPLVAKLAKQGRDDFEPRPMNAPEWIV